MYVQENLILSLQFRRDEWRLVYKLIYSEDSTDADKCRALKILRIWKARMPVFSDIEGTYIILDVIVRCKNSPPEDTYAQYFMAIIR